MVTQEEYDAVVEQLTQVQNQVLQNIEGLTQLSTENDILRETISTLEQDSDSVVENRRLAVASAVINGVIARIDIDGPVNYTAIATAIVSLTTEIISSIENKNN